MPTIFNRRSNIKNNSINWGQKTGKMAGINCLILWWLCCLQNWQMPMAGRKLKFSQSLTRSSSGSTLGLKTTSLRMTQCNKIGWMQSSLGIHSSSVSRVLFPDRLCWKPYPKSRKQTRLFGCWWRPLFLKGYWKWSYASFHTAVSLPLFGLSGSYLPFRKLPLPAWQK